MTNERFTSLIPTPPVVAGEPTDHSPAPEAWDQYKAVKAHDHMLKHEAEGSRKVYDVIDSMMAGLVMSHGELLRLRGVLVTFFYEEVSVQSIEMSAAVLPQ